MIICVHIPLVGENIIFVHIWELEIKLEGNESFLSTGIFLCLCVCCPTYKVFLA